MNWGPTSWQTITMQLLAMLFVLVLLLFVPAGSLAWTKGWIFVLVSTVSLIIGIFYLRRVNPAIFTARSRIHKGTVLWDRILIGFLTAAYCAIIVVAALDDGRYKWTHMPWWGVIVGYALFAVGFTLTAWAEGVNRFFEPGVRIQTERGHHVVDTGPYAYVRHPGYVAGCLLFAAVALSLGSLWALVPAACASLLLILRTYLEDHMLLQKLFGYTDYSRRVRFRLIPGVW